MKKNRAAAFLMAVMIGISVPQTVVEDSGLIVAEAHGGRTDGRGGHRDNRNRSGLGSYHYHCGSYPAHLHENGVCPYMSGETDALEETRPAEEPPADLENLSLVFDYKYYADNNPDLCEAFGYDEARLREHFLTCGMREGRRGCENFCVRTYRENNADLEEAFGDDLGAYYDHYMRCGRQERRVCY